VRIRMRWWKWTILALVVILGAGFGMLCHFMGSPRDVYGFLRYALPQWRKGDLKVGQQAPDFSVYSLDGQSTFSLSDHIGKRPVVVIFGSYT
jgi:hypothetical protein